MKAFFFFKTTPRLFPYIKHHTITLHILPILVGTLTSKAFTAMAGHKFPKYTKTLIHTQTRSTTRPKQTITFTKTISMLY